MYIFKIYPYINCNKLYIIFKQKIEKDRWLSRKYRQAQVA